MFRKPDGSWESALRLKKQETPDLCSSLENVWHLLMPRHLFMAFGPPAVKRNTEHVCMLPCFDIFSCPLLLSRKFFCMRLWQ